MAQLVEITPDRAAVKAKQQLTWASGDFSVVAALVVLASEQLCDTAVPTTWVGLPFNMGRSPDVG